jgi:hypothetical protein
LQGRDDAFLGVFLLHGPGLHAPDPENLGGEKVLYAFSPRFFLAYQARYMDISMVVDMLTCVEVVKQGLVMRG